LHQWLFSSFGAVRQWVQSTNGKNQLINNQVPVVLLCKTTACKQ